ncbi:MAG: hypothetical protein PHS44_02080 [Candidatus Dojkabacteria bacterium]|nr:hypothetical protein [Candidatus Dojkabacteria bacterium]
MITLPTTPALDKDRLVDSIKDKFLHIDQYKYKRILAEFLDDKGNYLGDNFFETTFKFQSPKPPVVYEISGPYDSICRKFAGIARVFYEAQLVYEYDHVGGINQRTAAMTLAYLMELKHKANKVLVYGPGKVSTQVVSYLKHFYKDLKNIDYVHYEKPNPEFEKNINEIGIESKFKKEPDLKTYDTIILATTTKDYCLTKAIFEKLKPGACVVSLCTTSATGEIEPACHGLQNVQVFLDYEDSKTFTNEMKEANEKGCLENVTYFTEVLKKKVEKSSDKVNLVRLTGTPMQNIAVIEMMLAREGINL